MRLTLGISLALACVGALAVMIAGCESGAGNDPPPTGKYAQIQANIFTPNCATSGCHSGSAPANGMSLEAGKAYDALVGAAPQNPGALNAGFLRVDPFHSDNSFLYRKISDDLNDINFPGKAMPRDLPSLSDADVELIRQWIDEGAPR